MYSISLLKIHTTHLNMQKSKMSSSKEACLVLLTPGFRNLSPSEPFFRTHLFMCHGTSEILRSRSEKKKKIINLDKCTSDGTWAQATAGPGTITSFPQTLMEALTVQQPDGDKARESWGGLGGLSSRNRDKDKLELQWPYFNLKERFKYFYNLGSHPLSIPLSRKHWQRLTLLYYSNRLVTDP